MTRIAVGGPPGSDVELVADAGGRVGHENGNERAARRVQRALGRRPETRTWK